MKRAVATMVLVGVAIVLAVSPARTAPKPSEVPISWQLDIELQPLKAIELMLPGYTVPRRFWYLRYSVTNRTRKDRIFVPDFDLYTGTGQIVRAGQKVPTSVFKAIKSIYNDPLLKDMTGMTGKLLQGEDNAKGGVAIWGEFDPKAGSIDIFFGGVSGETAEVRLPSPIKVVEIDSKGNETFVVKDKIILARTLQLSYSIPGEHAARLRTPPELIRKQWIMR